MVTKPLILTLISLVLIAITGCQTPWWPGSNDQYVSADVSGKGTQSGFSFLTGAATSDIATQSPAPEQNGDASTQVSREIEEADIVKLIDGKLYLLNSFRGLKIVDVSNWSQPTLKGSVEFVGEPIEMYIVNGVASIIVQNYYGCRLDVQGKPVKQSGSTVYMVNVANADAPVLIDTFDIDGYVGETRRVGDVIYLAGNSIPSYWGRFNTPDQGETMKGFVVSLLASDPANVKLVDSKEFPGQGEYIHASQNAIFISGFDWGSGKTIIQYVDISDPAGAISLRGTCRANGQILNRFAMDADGNVLRVVVENLWWWSMGPSTMEGDEAQRAIDDRRGVKLFTYDLSNPDNITDLGGLFIVSGETLRAVRFDGLKAYVVTFEQKDPLWVINLTDPAKPVISGWLEAPGYSTYLQSDGNRLVAVGVNAQGDWRASVMLYDVADPAAPKELDRAVLGTEYSSSTANYDDKAFKVLAEAKLILVPFDSWTNGAFKNQLSMLDYSADNLTSLATIDHRGTVLRSGVDLASNVLWMLSQQSLRTLDITEKTNPKTLAELTIAENILAWKVLGQYGLRLALVNANASESAVELQVLAANDPNGTAILARQVFNLYNPKLNVVDASLAVLTGIDKDGKVRVITIDLAALPSLSVPADKALDIRLADGWWGGYALDSISVDRMVPGFSPVMDYMPLVPCWQSDQDNPLVLSNRGLAFVTVPLNAAWYDALVGRKIQLVSLTDSANPQLAGSADINGSDFDMVYRIGSSGTTVFATVERIIAKPVLTQMFAPQGNPQANYYVRLFDCADLSNPEAGDPVNVPGIAVGLKGDVVFSVDPQWSDSAIGTRFCASRVSGGNARQLEVIDLPAGAPGKVLFTDSTAVMAMQEFSYNYGYGYGYEYAVSNIASSTSVSSASATGGSGAKTDDCNLGTYRLVSINISDPANMSVASNDEYSGSTQLIAISGDYLVGQILYGSQAAIWKINDDQTLTLNRIVDLPAAVTDVTSGNGAVDLACGPGGVVVVIPAP